MISDQVKKGKDVYYERYYYDVFIAQSQYLDRFWRSFFLGGGIAVGQMIVSVLAGYGFAKCRFPGKNVLWKLIMLTLLFSGGVTALPSYIVKAKLGLINTYWVLILPSLASTLHMFLMRQFMLQIPDSLLDAAKLDGATNWDLFKSIYMPLSGPALATISLYYFVGSWNSYFWSMLILTDKKKIPLQVVLKKLIVELNINLSEATNVDVTTLSRETVVFATIIAVYHI